MVVPHRLTFDSSSLDRRCEKDSRQASCHVLQKTNELQFITEVTSEDGEKKERKENLAWRELESIPIRHATAFSSRAVSLSSLPGFPIQLMLVIL